jgi:hypothetical protein
MIRDFRIHYFGEHKRLTKERGEEFFSNERNFIDIMLRQRLVRAGLADAVVIGAFENIYRARGKEWVLRQELRIMSPP